jgi:WD40 repeat protein
MAFAGDLLLTVADDKKVRAWKFAGDTPSRNLQHPNLVNAVAFDKTGTLLATGGQDGVLRIWDVSKKEVPAAKAVNAHVPAAPQPPRAIYAVVWTPDAKQLVTASDDKSIKFWDADGKPVREIKPGSDRPPPSDAMKAASPMVLGGAGQAVLSQPPSPGHTDQVYSLAITADGKYLASGSADKTVKLWNPATGELVRAFANPTLKVPTDSHPGFVQCVKFTPDGSKLVSVGTAPKNKGYLAVWNVADGKLLAGYELAVGPIYSVDVTADGTAVLGCGPKTRGTSESEAVVTPLPK